MTDLATTTTSATDRESGTERWSGSGTLTQVRVLTLRSLRALRDPRMMLLNLVQPLIMLTLFSQVFRTIADSPDFPAGVSYINYLMPAILVTTGAQAAMWAGAGLATDLRNGALSRFRTLPIRMPTVLVGRSLFDLTRSAIQLTVLTVAAVLLFDFAPPGGVAGTLAAILIGMTVGTGLSWVFIAAASWLRNVELLQMTGMLVIFPLMFASSAFVPIEGLPGWLQAIAVVNPLTYAIDASRGWALGDPALGATVGAVLAAAALVLIGGSLAARAIRKP